MSWPRRMPFSKEAELPGSRWVMPDTCPLEEARVQYPLLRLHLPLFPMSSFPILWYCKSYVKLGGGMGGSLQRGSLLPFSSTTLLPEASYEHLHRADKPLTSSTWQLVNCLSPTYSAQFPPHSALQISQAVLRLEQGIGL